MAIKKKVRATSKKKRTTKAGNKATPRTTTAKARPRVATKKKPAARPATTSKTIKKKSASTAARRTSVKGSPARKTTSTTRSGAAPARPAAIAATRPASGAADSAAGAWGNMLDASPWAKLRRGAGQVRQVVKRVVTGKTVETGESDTIGDMLTAAPWAKQIKAGAASAAVRETRHMHKRRNSGGKTVEVSGFADLMAASPWATKTTPAFMRRSTPEATPAPRPIPAPKAAPVNPPASTATVGRDSGARRGANPVPMAALSASVSPAPTRRATETNVPSAPHSVSETQRPVFAARPAPVSRPARETQRDELGEAIRELAGAVAESQFTVKKQESTGLSDAERLKMRLAERQRTVSRVAEEEPPRFRPKQRAPIPKRPVASSGSEFTRPATPAADAAAPRATVTERPAAGSTTFSNEEAQKKKLAKTIPVEGLGRGVFNALSNGVGRVVNVGRQSVSGIALGAKDGARLVSGFFKGKNPTTKTE